MHHFGWEKKLTTSSEFKLTLNWYIYYARVVELYTVYKGGCTHGLGVEHRSTNPRVRSSIPTAARLKYANPFFPTLLFCLRAINTFLSSFLLPTVRLNCRTLVALIRGRWVFKTRTKLGTYHRPQSNSIEVWKSPCTSPNPMLESLLGTDVIIQT